MERMDFCQQINDTEEISNFLKDKTANVLSYENSYIYSYERNFRYIR